MNANQESVYAGLYCGLLAATLIAGIGIGTHDAGTACMGVVVGIFAFVGIAAAHAMWHR